MADSKHATPIEGHLVEVGLLALAVALPLALGATLPAAALVAAVVAAASIVLLAVYRRLYLRVPWYAGVLLALMAVTALQLLPLPPALLELVAPATVDLLKVSLAGTGGGGGWHPISLDPPATAWELMKLGAVTLTFVVAHNHLRRPERRTRLMAAMLLGGCATVLVGFAGALAGGGAAAPAAHGGALITTSFFNPNHGAAYLAICTVVGAALVTQAQRRYRTLIVVATVWTGAGVFLTLSRGGIVALGAGLGALALLVSQLDQPGPRRRTVTVMAAAGLIIFGAAALAHEQIVSELFPQLEGRDMGLGKVALWPAGLAMVLDNALVGVGRGAFVSAFTRYVDPAVFGREVTFSHLENQYLHLPAEWGLVIGGGAIALTAFAWLRWVCQAQRDPASTAAGAALLALAVHALFDYNLELAGVALPAAVLAGLASAPPRRPSAAPSAEQRLIAKALGRGRLPATFGVWVVLLVAVCTLALAALGVRRPLTDAAQELEPARELIHQGASLDRIRAAVTPVIRRHPADYFPHLVLGREAGRRHRPEAIRWLNRAMLLNPRSPQVHRETAEALWRLGHRRQALIEYRSALTATGRARDQLLRETLPRCRDLHELLLLLPPHPQLHARAVQLLLQAKRNPLAVRLADEAHTRWPRSATVAAVTARALLADGQRAKAAEVAAELAKRHPSPAHQILLARTAAADERRLTILNRALADHPKDTTIGFALAEAYLAAGRFGQAHEQLKLLLRQLGDSRDLARAHEVLARVYGAEGRHHEAKWAHAEARRLRAMP